MIDSYKSSTISIYVEIHIFCKTSIKKEVWTSMKFLYLCISILQKPFQILEQVS